MILRAAIQGFATELILGMVSLCIMFFFAPLVCVRVDIFSRRARLGGRLIFLLSIHKEA